MNFSYIKKKHFAVGKLCNIKGVKIMNFTDKTALVTGAAVGIGCAVVLKLAQEVADKGVLVNCVAPGSVSPSEIRT